MYNSMFYTPSSAAADFESILETLDPQKWCSRVGAVLFLRKSRFSDQIRFWIDFFMIFDAFGIILGRLLGSKSHPKLDQKSIQILDRFLIDFGSQYASILVNFGTKNRSKIRLEI